MSSTNDSNDLEALFDSIAADFAPVVPAPAVVSTPPPAVSRQSSSSPSDDDDLQALFDSISAETEVVQSQAASASSEAVATGESWPAQEGVFNRIGQMARALHDTLGQLGYDKLLEKTVSALPDAKDRLAWPT